MKILISNMKILFIFSSNYISNNIKKRKKKKEKITRKQGKNKRNKKDINS